MIATSEVTLKKNKQTPQITDRVVILGDFKRVDGQLVNTKTNAIHTISSTKTADQPTNVPDYFEQEMDLEKENDWLRGELEHLEMEYLMEQARRKCLEKLLNKFLKTQAKKSED